MTKERVDDRQALRPTEAQLRWAQFHRKTRARHVQEKLERLYQTPASPSDVPDALSEDGVTTDSSAGSQNNRREKPKISRGRRAMLRVSKRAYERRRISIQENGFQCSDDKENEIDDDEEEDAVFAMFAEETVRKKHRKRRQSRRHRAEDEEQRFRRFEAAYHAMMMNMMPQEQPELTPAKRWTRASHVPVAVSIDGRQYDDLKWGFSGRKARAVRDSGTATPSSAPFDRRASWLVHLPRRHESSRRLSFAPPVSSDGEVLEPENGYGPYDEPANFFSPGQMKFDELVARLRLRELELAKEKGQESIPLGQREAQGKAAKFRQKYSHRHSADRMEDANMLVDGGPDPSFPATDIYGFPCLDDGSPDGQFSEAESDFWRRARNMYDTVPAGMASGEYLPSTMRGQEYEQRNEMGDPCLDDGSPDGQFSEAESDFWRRARNMHDTVPAGIASGEYIPSTLQGQEYEHRNGTGARAFGPLPDMVPGEHPYNTLRRQLAAKGQPHSVRTSDSGTSPSDSGSEQLANLRASGADSIVKRQIQYMGGPVGSADHDAPSAVPKLSQRKIQPGEPSLSKKGAFRASNEETMVKRRVQDMDRPAGSADYYSPTTVPRLSQEKLGLFEEMPCEPKLLADETKGAFWALGTDSIVKRRVDHMEGPASSTDHDSPSAVSKLSQEKLGPFKAMSDESRLSTDGAKAAFQTSGTASMVRRQVQGMDKRVGSPDHSPSAAPKLANEEFEPFEERDESMWSTHGTNTVLKRRIYELNDPAGSSNLDSPSSLSEAVPKVRHDKLDQMKEISGASAYSADDAEERLVGQRQAGASIESSQTPVSRQRPEEMDNSIGKNNQNLLAGPVAAAKLSEAKLEPSEERPAALRISSKVGGVFNSIFGSKKENDSEELRAVAAFRKTQGERRVLNDDATSTSSFRVLPEGIRRVVKNFATPKGKFSSIQSESEVSVGTSGPEHGTCQQARTSAAGFSTPSHSGTSRSVRKDFSPEHGRYMHQRVMENSALIGDLDGDATIIDTDGTTSDASGAMMDPKIAAKLFLSPAILTKRLHQAIRSIERHNWEQLTYLLNANPWLAEMADVTTGQYLLHKLALYGAGVAVMHPDTGDVVRVEAPAAPEELSFNLIRMFPASVHKFDQDGNLPLHMAAVSGNQEMCHFLGERFPSGASVRNEEGLLPLHMAIQSCSSPAPSADGTITSPSEIVKTILGFFPGAVAVADNDGNLPIHCAASALHGELGVDIIFMLLDEADIQVQNGLMFRVTELKTYDDDTETVATDVTATATELSAADDYSYCNLVRNKMGHTPLVTAVRSKAGWEIIEAIACGPGGRKAALLPDANMSNVLHLLVSGEFADPASILSVLKIAPQAAAVQNSEGMLPIEIACMQMMPREVILALVLVDLPIDLDEKAGIKVREGFGGSWCYLTCECDDHYVDVVEEVISICSYPQVRELCFAKCGPNGNGGSVISRATPSCRLALRKALRFVGRFEFLGTVALHTDVSLGLKVFEALDFGTENDDFEDGRRVLLRCYSREKAYLQETSVVREYRFDTSYVEDLFEFGVHEQDGQSSEVTPQQYCVAIELPSLSLDRVVVSMLETEDYKRNPDMRNRYFSKVCMVLRLIAKSIRHLHEVGVVHGDVCLENCGKFDDKWKLMSSLGMQPIGKRFGSARMGESSPPEAVEMLHNVVETRGQETSSRRATFKGDIVAGPAVDMWAFGKLIYEALTGEPLIRFDSSKDTRYDNRALLKLVSWNEGDLRNVVNSLEDSGVSTLGVDLVSHCLLPDPSERPSTMDEILEHPFWKDMRRKGVMARRSNDNGRHEI